MEVHVKSNPAVAVVMGSSSDHKVMQAALDVLEEFDVAYEAHVLSAHRQPKAMINFGSEARDLGFQVIIAGAGGAAHLPGMLASVTTLPVIGVPISATKMDGVDALLSIVQMPKGVPVATVAIDGARNAGLLAISILSLSDARLAGRLEEMKGELAAAASAQDAELFSS
ncbi:MAG: 5-(carboxyamino)imidazole ribonucleotide mutase [Actinomycetes bacterium]